ncbi:unnamed protein product [Eretmochelys imbricata]
MDTSVTRIIFCKDSKEILMLPKDRNKFIFESAQPVSPESPGEYFCRYQHKDDRNQEKTSLPSARQYLSAPGDLPAPTLILNKGPTPQGDTIILLCFIPMDTSVTRIIFCKDSKEILMLPKDRNKFIFESAQPVSPESPGEYFCRYQHKDDRNQEKTSLPSARQYLSAPAIIEGNHNLLYIYPTDILGARNSGGEASAKGPAVLLWVWILRSTLVLLLVTSALIITCIMEKRAVAQPDLERQERPAGKGRGEPPYIEGNGGEEEKEEEAGGSGGP